MSRQVKTPSGTYTVSEKDAEVVHKARKKYGAELLLDRGLSSQELAGFVFGREVFRVKVTP